MTDVSHELGALRFVVESPLSSKVAMFNNAATRHQESQQLNPFSQNGGLPKPTFKKDEYGRPVAGSLTEMRGQKANIHVLKEMLELCQIIDSEGYQVKDEPTMKVIPFGELFNIYTYISDKVVGILLRARKHKLIDFEGEVLFQRRDDDVPIFLLKPIAEIRKILEHKQEEIRRSVSPAAQATTVIMDHQKRSLSASPTPTSSRKSEHRTNLTKSEILTPVTSDVSTTTSMNAENSENNTKDSKTEAVTKPKEPINPAEDHSNKEVPLVQITPPVEVKMPIEVKTPVEISTPIEVKTAVVVTTPVEVKSPVEVSRKEIQTEDISSTTNTRNAPPPTSRSAQNVEPINVVVTSTAVIPQTVIVPPTPTEDVPSTSTIEPEVKDKTDINNNKEPPVIDENGTHPPAEVVVSDLPTVS